MPASAVWVISRCIRTARRRSTNILSVSLDTIISFGIKYINGYGMRIDNSNTDVGDIHGIATHIRVEFHPIRTRRATPGGELFFPPVRSPFPPEILTVLYFIKLNFSRPRGKSPHGQMSLLVNADSNNEAITLVRYRLLDAALMEIAFAGDEEVTLWQFVKIETVPDEGLVLDVVRGLDEETPGMTAFLPAFEGDGVHALPACLPDAAGEYTIAFPILDLKTEGQK